MSECTAPYQNCGYKTHFTYSDPRGTNTVKHDRNVSIGLHVGGVEIVGHKERRDFRLHSETTPPHAYQIPDFFIVNKRLAYQTAEPSMYLDVENCGYRDGIYGMVQVPTVVCASQPVTVVAPVLTTSISEYYEVIDSYFITLDLDAECCIYRKDSCRITASAESSKGIGYISQQSYGTLNLEARNAVVFNPDMTIKRELHVVVNGNDFIVASTTESRKLYSRGFLLVYPGYYLDSLLYNPLTEQETRDYNGVSYGAGWKSAISLDWKFDDQQNYYFKADPVMNPGDKESLDGSFKWYGDYFYPKWIKKVMDYGFRPLYAAAASARVGLDPSFHVDDLGTIIPMTDVSLSYSSISHPVSRWMDNSGSTGQIVWHPERKEAVFSVVDARMGITVNGRYSKDELHLDIPVDGKTTLFPISYGDVAQ